MLCGVYAENKKQEFKDAVWLMWHGAVLTRLPPAKIPSIEDLISPQKQLDEEGVKGFFRRYEKIRNLQNGNRD